MNLFIYPKTTHVRSHEPSRQYKRYQTYKRALRIEFSGRCIYCRTIDNSRGGPDTFGVEHYLPKQHFPKLATKYANLYYCCNACNSRKGAYWPDPAKNLTKFIPNPCDHVMFDHLRFKGYKVEHHSINGEFSVETLDLNDPEMVMYREYLTESVKALQEKLSTALSLKTKLENILKNDPSKRAQAEKALDKLNKDIAGQERAIHYVTN